MVVFVDKEYGAEDTLATVVSGLVLGCLLVVFNYHHPIVARQKERARQCHPVDGGLAVARRVASRLSKTTVLRGTGRCRRRVPFGISGSRPVFRVAGNLGRGLESPPLQVWDKGESSESLVSYVAAVHDCRTGGKACVPASVPTRKEG
jgi:hypothetical protein